MSKFKDLVRNLPNKPGVYRFYTAEDGLLYIGKAKNLKNRVSSYFQEGRPRNQRLTLMVSQIDRVEYTEVKSEKESLILEANLIHQLQPKYNILLKDDKSYVYVRFSYRDPIPGIFLTRRKYDTASDYFGPYTKKYGIENTLRLLRQIFPYCQERFFTGKACQYVGIKQCDGICSGLETKENYVAKLEQIKSILSGKTEVAEKFINTKMMEAIGNNNFELAALWRDRLALLKETIVDQKIILPHPQDLDIITLIVDQPTTDGLVIGSIFVQNIRAGKMINVNNFLLSGTSEKEINPEESSNPMLENNFDKQPVPDNNQGLNLIETEVKQNPEENQLEQTNETSDEQDLEMQFIQRFVSTYYSQNNDQVESLIQIYRKEEV